MHQYEAFRYFFLYCKILASSILILVHRNEDGICKDSYHGDRGKNEKKTSINNNEEISRADWEAKNNNKIKRGWYKLNLFLCVNK